MERPEYHSMISKKAMNRVNAPGMNFRWSLNPYRGCLHGCAFCYARPTHEYLGLSADDSFRRDIFVKSNAPEALETQLSLMASEFGGDLGALAASVGHLAIGTATDPYQPIEARRGLTRACLEVLARYRIPVSVTTRSPLILRDLDLLRRMDVYSVNFSLNTLDLRVLRNLEPSTPTPEKRLQAISRLVENGVRAGIFLAPVIPGLTDGSGAILDLLRAAKRHQAQFVFPSVLRLTPGVREWFWETAGAKYPRLMAFWRGLYRGGPSPPASYTDALYADIHRKRMEIGFIEVGSMEAGSMEVGSMEAGSMEIKFLEGIELRKGAGFRGEVGSLKKSVQLSFSFGDLLAESPETAGATAVSNATAEGAGPRSPTP